MSDPHDLATLRPRLIYLLNSLNLLARKSLDERLKPFNLGGLQYTILALVRDREGISSAELSRRFFVTPQTMNESVTALERRGLIARSESEANKRILNSRITDDGRALLDECDQIADALEQDVFGDLSDADQKTLHRILRDQQLKMRTAG
ncbi:MarR family winged helix-turn-helix transcriptional regulator [Pararhodobacter zhoushanensis]|uniref:MarR family transcriptional regulator n=1 Tax=Pararhodobacter zhoushanensis TaxID=2479545 RepID=A0ABT3GT56_9RHOB|nr:MarR family transcriptional regulator [Pararhodobacter zhoushanensis]MCW1930737.1 MarR family transcriptional regulator [Pararhodobacter zhoushanensis]